MGMKALVTYFSASGETKKVAEKLAAAVKADLYEIRPEIPYNAQDLVWMNKNSRSSVEMNDPDCRPALADKDAEVALADVIFIGFPVWWYREPSIIDTFLESYDFTGKKIVPFCTSGGSDIGKTAERMSEIAGVKVETGKRFDVNVSVEDLKAWADSI